MLLYPLKTLCEVVLMNFINRQNAVMLFICSDRYHVDYLKQKCKQYIMDHYDAVFFLFYIHLRSYLLISPLISDVKGTTRVRERAM